MAQPLGRYRAATADKQSMTNTFQKYTTQPLVSNTGTQVTEAGHHFVTFGHWLSWG